MSSTLVTTSHDSQPPSQSCIAEATAEFKLAAGTFLCAVAGADEHTREAIYASYRALDLPSLDVLDDLSAAAAMAAAAAASLAPETLLEEPVAELSAGSEAEEFDVGVSFYAYDFVLTVRWTTSATTDDETRVMAAHEWFRDTYGFDPAEYSTDISVERIPEP